MSLSLWSICCTTWMTERNATGHRDSIPCTRSHHSVWGKICLWVCEQQHHHSLILSPSCWIESNRSRSKRSMLTHQDRQQVEQITRVLEDSKQCKSVCVREREPSSAVDWSSIDRRSLLMEQWRGKLFKAHPYLQSTPCSPASYRTRCTHTLRIQDDWIV